MHIDDGVGAHLKTLLGMQLDSWLEAPGMRGT